MTDKAHQLKPIRRVRFLKYEIRKRSNTFPLSDVPSISHWKKKLPENDHIS